MRAEPAQFWAVVVAAGSGRRFGAPKQFELLSGERLVDRALRTTRTAPGCIGVVAVVPAFGPAGPPDLAHAEMVVAGGATRSESVRAGLAEVPPATDIVVVHDAARPLADAALFVAVAGAVRDGADGAVPGLALADTVKRVGPPMGDRQARAVLETLAREDLVAVQTPQAFRARALRDAHAAGDQATDDATLVEAAGGRVVVVAGDPWNLKVTTPTDLALADALSALRHPL